MKNVYQDLKTITPLEQSTNMEHGLITKINVNISSNKLNKNLKEITTKL